MFRDGIKTGPLGPLVARGYSQCPSLIGALGFEPRTSPTRTVRATRLRHAPNAGQYDNGR